MYVIGTAGHVDHGKSALVLALTGIDPDRLREEKERGMTIDLGFAWVTLPSVREVSVVDVPGHERFIKNMLAGVGGIDLAMLIIAADEGVMPQTREHLAILDLLGVSRGVVVITKSDLVDRDWLELVSADALETIAPTSLAGAPVVACSAITGAGIDDLRKTLDALLDATKPRRDLGRPRLPIDRAFTIGGFGTVVTGTLVDGSLKVGQEVELLPSGKRVRVRGLQSHRTKVESLAPGVRCAANLAGVSVEEIRRGMVLTAPGWLQPTAAVDVPLRALASNSHTLRHGLRLTFHSGAAESSATLRLLDRDELLPGVEGWAQVRLDEPLALVRGDAFVLRTSNETVGGGRIADVHAKRHRRNHAPTLAALERLRQAAPAEVVFELLSRAEPATADRLARGTELTQAAVAAALAELVADGRAIPAGTRGEFLTRPGLDRIAAKASALLAAAHRDFPLRPGVSQDELRTRLGIGSREFPAIVAALVDTEVLIDRHPLLAAPGFEPAPTALQATAADRFVSALEAAGAMPPTDMLPDAEMLAYLEHGGRVVRVADGIVFGARAYADIEDRVVRALSEAGTITLAEVRDLLGTSRKYAQALLEYLDEKRVTARMGDVRVLRSPGGGGR